MKFQIDAASSLGQYVDPTAWQNSTLRYSPPEDFPAFLSKEIGRAKIMRAWITLDEYWDYRTNEFYPDYDIGVARYAPETLHYVYDWASIVPAPSGTRFKAYLTTHAENADEIVAYLYGNGYTVYEIKKNKVGLEEYYIELMSRREAE